MAWIESHQSLAHHPKMQQLAFLLGISEPCAIGHLHLLWWWCMDYAQDGDITAFAPEVIAKAAQWKGKPAKFIDALVECGPSGRPGFLERTADNHVRIHDWSDFAGRLIERRREDSNRKRDSRQSSVRAPSAGCPQDVRRTSAGNPQDVRSENKTCPTDGVRTQPNLPNQPMQQAGARAHVREEEPAANGKEPAACLPAGSDYIKRLTLEPEGWTEEEIRLVDVLVTKVRNDTPSNKARYYVPLLQDLRSGTIDADQLQQARQYISAWEMMGLK